MEYDFKKNKIKELRTAIDYSQCRLAKEIQTSQANISRWEDGIIVPSVSECWKLADFFGVSIDYLCGRSDF